MFHYRIIYAKNEIISCIRTPKAVLKRKEPYRFEESNGQMIYALVRAENKAAAETAGKWMVKQLLINKKKKLIH